MLDERTALVIAHLRIVASKTDRPLVVQDYLAYRIKHAPELPSLTTVYRMFGSWDDALEVAKVARKEKRTRTPDVELIGALKQVSLALETKILSTPSYDSYRKSHAPDLPSSAVIRKWLGPWPEAVGKAGLETTGKPKAKHHGLSDIVFSVRLAKQKVANRLTAEIYQEFYNELCELEKDDVVDFQEIMNYFASWDLVLQAADVEQEDHVHPSGLWTSEEARRIALQVERVMGECNENSYNTIFSRSTRPMPSWPVLSELLAR